MLIALFQFCPVRRLKLLRGNLIMERMELSPAQGENPGHFYALSLLGNFLPVSAGVISSSDVPGVNTIKKTTS